MLSLYNGKFPNLKIATKSSRAMQTLRACGLLGSARLSTRRAGWDRRFGGIRRARTLIAVDRLDFMHRMLPDAAQTHSGLSISAVVFPLLRVLDGGW